MQNSDQNAGPGDTSGLRSDISAEVIRATALRHPWRNLISVALLVFLGAFLYDASHREIYDWPTYKQYLFNDRVLSGVVVTLELTAYAMVIAILLGIVLAVMRQSPNPVLKSLAWSFIWFFRGTPVYVQLVFWGLLSTVYPSITFGIPHVGDIATIPSINNLSLFVLAVIGLALNEAAYMAEIVRAGLLSVDRGQEEAAKALGMGWGLSMRRIIIPQAMRIIIPPTGNEVISMLKTTSLVTAIPLTIDLYMATRDISANTYKPVPLLLVASTWYLVFTSVLMVLQYFLEKRFARGYAQMGLEANSLAREGQGGG
jgi:polar amino acid transport system permease protein